MAGHGEDPAELAQFTGWRKYYNTTTNLGRRNISAVTLTAIFGTIAYFTVFRKKEPAKA